MTPPITRRGFLALGGASLVLPLAGCAATMERRGDRRPFRFGVLADLHHGLDPRAMERLEAFLADAEARGVDAVAQLGDFNYADAGAQECLALWRQTASQRSRMPPGSV